MGSGEESNSAYAAMRVCINSVFKLTGNVLYDYGMARDLEESEYYTSQGG